jgi:hypothetical protein
VVVDSRLERQARNESLIRGMNERIERLDRAAEAGLEGEHLVLNFSASAERVKRATPAARSRSR